MIVKLLTKEEIREKERNDTLLTGENNSYDSRFFIRNNGGHKEETHKIFQVLKEGTVNPDSYVQ